MSAAKASLIIAVVALVLISIFGIYQAVMLNFFVNSGFMALVLYSSLFMIIWIVFANAIINIWKNL